MSDDKQLLTAFTVLGAHIQALRDELAKLRPELAGVRDLAERRQQQLYETMRDRDAISAANATLNKRVRELDTHHTATWEDAANMLHEWGIWRAEHIPGEKGGYVWRVQGEGGHAGTGATLRGAVEELCRVSGKGEVQA